MALWDYPTNFSNGTTVDSLGNLVSYMSYVSNGWGATAFVFAVFMITFGLSYSTGASSALLVSSFIGFMFTVLFLRIEAISPAIIWVFVLLAITGFLFRMADRRGGQI